MTGMETASPRRAGRGLRAALMVAVALLVAAVAACCVLMARQRAQAALETELAAQLEQTRQELSERDAALEQAQTELEDSRAALEAAGETIGLLEEYTILTEDGTPPEYTQLYPDLYAEAREEAQAPEGKTVYLTFDDGPSSNTEHILRILEQYDVKATFFVLGKTGEQDQQRMRDIVAAGHTLAVHSWSHDYKTIYASVEAFLEDFYRLYQWIHEVTGVYPQVFRFPGGSLNGYNQGTYEEIISEMVRRGFVYFDWNASAQDATVTPLDPSVITANCLRGIGREQVVMLAHDSAARTTTVQALPAIIEGYRNAGYTFAALTPAVKPVIMGYRAPR